MDNLPSDEEIKELFADEINRRIDERKSVEENVDVDKITEEAVEEIKERLTNSVNFAKRSFKYVFFCKARKAVVVGNDVPTQSITQCNDFTEVSGGG